MMNEADVVEVLASAAAFDARLTPPSKEDARRRVAAWFAALAKDMPPQFALERIAKHYSRSREVVMPADLNDAWRQAKHEEITRRESESRALGYRGVPMPPEVRAQVDALLRKSRA